MGVHKYDTTVKSLTLLWRHNCLIVKCEKYRMLLTRSIFVVAITRWVLLSDFDSFIRFVLSFYMELEFFRKDMSFIFYELWKYLWINFQMLKKIPLICEKDEYLMNKHWTTNARSFIWNSEEKSLKTFFEKMTLRKCLWRES